MNFGRARWIGLAAAAVVSGCAASPPVQEPSATGAQPNFLVLIADDMGKETLSCYDVGSSPASTPNIDRLCSEGVVFERFWTQPICSPTRANLLTGEYGFATGVVQPVMPNIASAIDQPPPPADANPEHRIMKPEDILNFVPADMVAASRGLPVGQLTLPEVLRRPASGYATGAFGKWHLGDPVNGAHNSPNTAGFDYFSGYTDGTLTSFFAWKHVINGEEQPATGYFTSRIVDDATSWINEQNQPWFAWIAFTAPHEPFHLPPKSLLNADAAALDPAGVGPGNDTPYFIAAIEAMDKEIGRLLSSVPEEVLDNTYVLFMSDNGSPGQATGAPYAPDKVKGSVYQGGVEMPFILNGPGITPSRYRHLTNSTDVFQTILDLAGAPHDALPEDSSSGAHSISFAQALFGEADAAPREWVYAHGRFLPNLPLNRAVRNERYKLAIIQETEHFFDLEEDPFEHQNLLTTELDANQQSELQKLRDILANLN